MDEVVRYSRERFDKGSKSFAGAARLFRPATRDDAFMLYAWCRYCDDQIDGQELGHSKVGRADEGGWERLAHLRLQTRRALAAETVSDPVFAAFQRVVLRHRIPARYPLELLEGFAMDVRGTRYTELADTLCY
ncbi:MAG: squalene/phytoene synthase family protein, partial [Methyloligellaceae bacterium]